MRYVFGYYSGVARIEEVPGIIAWAQYSIAMASAQVGPGLAKPLGYSIL